MVPTTSTTEAPAPQKNEPVSERAAYHEAGHAVVAWLAGMKIREARMFREDGGLACVTIHVANGDDFVPFYPDEADRTTAENFIRVLLAGPEAELKRTRSHLNVMAGAISDRIVVEEIAYGLYSPKDIRNQTRQLAREVQDQIYNPKVWDVVKATARRLKLGGTIPGAEVEQVIREAAAKAKIVRAA
jgi:hypothetical protein